MLCVTRTFCPASVKRGWEVQEDARSSWKRRRQWRKGCWRKLVPQGRTLSNARATNDQVRSFHFGPEAISLWGKPGFSELQDLQFWNLTKFPADPAKQDALCSVKIQDIIAVLLTHTPRSLMGKMGLILVPTKVPYKRMPWVLNELIHNGSFTEYQGNEISLLLFSSSWLWPYFHRKNCAKSQYSKGRYWKWLTGRLGEILNLSLLSTLYLQD